MGNPNDPRDPMYQGQALQSPQPKVGGLHFLEGLGQLAKAGVLLFGGSDEESEGPEEQQPRRRRTRFGAAFNRPAAKPAGSCCRAKRPTPTTK